MVAGLSRFEKGVRLVLNGSDLQRQTLRLYGELAARQETWAGQLVFACGEGVSATGLPAAVSIAGGTSLVLDPDAAAVKSVFRKGGVDFVVNTLDEALRVLKNEIRKRRPLSVAVSGSLLAVLQEMGERGVAPDLQVSLNPSVAFPATRTLNLSVEGSMVNPSEALQHWLGDRGWSEVVLKSASMTEMRNLDARLFEIVPDFIRRTWVQRIGHYQRAAVGEARVVWLSKAEQAAMTKVSVA